MKHVSLGLFTLLLATMTAQSASATELMIAAAMQRCTSNEECTLVTNSCSDNCAYVPVNQANLSILQSSYQNRCGKAMEANTTCNMVPPVKAACINSRCTLDYGVTQNATPADYKTGAFPVAEEPTPSTVPADQFKHVDDRHGFTAYNLPQNDVKQKVIGTLHQTIYVPPSAPVSGGNYVPVVPGGTAPATIPAAPEVPAQAPAVPTAPQTYTPPPAAPAAPVYAPAAVPSMPSLPAPAVEAPSYIAPAPSTLPAPSAPIVTPPVAPAHTKAAPAAPVNYGVLPAQPQGADTIPAAPAIPPVPGVIAPSYAPPAAPAPTYVPVAPQAYTPPAYVPPAPGSAQLPTLLPPANATNAAPSENATIGSPMAGSDIMLPVPVGTGSDGSAASLTTDGKLPAPYNSTATTPAKESKAKSFAAGGDKSSTSGYND